MDNVIVVASGKGGTGKSTVCICLSVALIKQGKKVLLIDCDCGMRGLDIMLDMENDIVFDAADAVSGNCSFTDAVYKSKNNENLYLMAAPFDTCSEQLFKLLGKINCVIYGTASNKNSIVACNSSYNFRVVK